MLKKTRRVSLILMTFAVAFSGSAFAESRSESLSTDIAQQQRSVTGTVTDVTGEPIIGASVIVKGSQTGTITNLDGNFTLNASKGATLVISFIGYTPQEVVATEAPLNVRLKEDTKLLDEVVVVGFATVKKENLTGAVSSVDNKILEDRPLTNLGQGLQGAVSNLNITTSGRPGDGSTYNVRGTTSLNGGGPLVLVDGVEMDPNLINPQDVKSVSVLKDAASASIYGSRAAYGVILITTKGGRRNQPTTISVDASLSFNGPTTRPKFMDSMEYANYMNAANMTTNGRNYFDDVQMKHITDYYNDPINNLPVYKDPNNPESAGGTKYIYCGNEDWMAAMYRKNYPVQNYNVNINGGSEKVTYYTSAGLMDQGSLIKYGNEHFKKFNVMNNISYDITKWLNVGVKTTFNRTELSGLMQAAALGNVFIGSDTRPIMPVRHPDGNFSGQGNFTNYAALLDEGGTRDTNKNDFWNTVTAKLTPLEGLSVNFDYTFNYYAEVNKFHTKEYMQYGVDGKALEVFPFTKPNGVSMSNAGDTYNAINFFIDYEKTLGKHYLKGLVGFNQETKHNKSFNAGRNSLIVNELPSMSYATGDKSVSENDNSWATRGGFVRLNYSFDDRYLLEVNGRYDLSSRFPKADRSVFNPSASAAWRISNEAFFSGAKSLIDELKIRGSYGSLGNQAIENYQPYLSNMGTGTTSWLFAGQQMQYVSPGGLVSSRLTWETVTQYDLGLDFAMFNNRLKGTFDYYQRTTSDILMKGKTLPSILGAGEPQENAASMRTNGWEAELSWNDRLSNGLTYTIGFNISDYQATITEYDNPNGTISNNENYKGKKVGEIWGYTTLGIFQSQQEIDAAADQSQLTGITTLPGDLKFANLNGNDRIDYGNNTLSNPGDQSVIGNSTPRYQYGIKGSLEWKNFDLNLFFQGVGKRDVNMPSTYFLAHYTTEWRTPSKINTDYWSENNRDAFFPLPRFNGGGSVAQSQTRFLQDASYLRMKSLVIGYTIPKYILEKIHIDKLRIYFSGENLLTFKHTPDGFDPEVLDALKYPLQRSLAFGLNLTF